MNTSKSSTTVFVDTQLWATSPGSVRRSRITTTPTPTKRGKVQFWAPPKNRHEEQIEDQLEQDFLYERALARIDAADQQLGKSPTIAEALHNAEPDSEESTHAMHQLITRLATEYGWQPHCETNGKSQLWREMFRQNPLLLRQSNQSASQVRVCHLNERRFVMLK